MAIAEVWAENRKNRGEDFIIWGGGMVCQCIPLCVPTCKHVCVVRERCECVGRFKKERHAHARKA